MRRRSGQEVSPLQFCSTKQEWGVLFQYICLCTTTSLDLLVQIRTENGESTVQRSAQWIGIGRHREFTRQM
ncbi:hypothetical protein BS47DRAFT_552863 [Hydnum rufescens UP504]|uniref:Uncharacterized protein n=1 Tax=Hydnum rufescens UP504 TaxID=1448309 RepID=A0A9P6B6P3_9AGAM|nr:hypothetical protein BS47DRAFT_552863 [Hydnum rufescens UP504]